MPSCSEFFSCVILICACRLSPSWDYYHNVWVRCAWLMGVCLQRGFIFALDGCLQSFACPGWIFSYLSVWDSGPMWIVFIQTPYLYVVQTRTYGPPRLDASLLLTQPPWEVLSFPFHKAGRAYVEVWASHFIWTDYHLHYHLRWSMGFYDSGPSFLGPVTKSAILQGSAALSWVVWVPL